MSRHPSPELLRGGPHRPYRWHDPDPAAPAAGFAAGVTLPGSGSAGSALGFRRRAVRPRRRRRSLWLRLLRPLAAALVLVGAPVGLAAWMLASPRFALREVSVEGTERVPAEWVRRRVEPLVGENLLRLPLARVERALAGHPWIAAVAIEKRLPDGLAVTLEEREPAVRVLRGERLWLADAAGRPIVEAMAGTAEDLMVVVPSPWDALPVAAAPAIGGGVAGAVDTAAAPAVATAVPAALALAVEVARSEPVWAAGLERMESLGQGEFRVFTRALPYPVVARAGELEPAAGRLGEVLGLLTGRRPALARLDQVDLRVPGRLVFRPVGAVPAAARVETVRHEESNRGEVG